MGLFDYYEPVPARRCPVCSTRLIEWQGADGGCGMLVWRQGTPFPVEQRVDSDIASTPTELEAMRLPDEFTIYSHDCACPYAVTAICSTKSGVWTNTDLVNADNARQWKSEPKREFKRRLAWLKGRL